MDDEGAVKAPVTRLRRRLSVEQSEEAKSSPAANTPTKKRGGRRTAKPELDLIDENAPDNNTSRKTIRKTAVKELEDVEEKPLTPSRRSARIRSNTSIVSETTQTFDSPRAKRAARRISQVGSDNEAPLTPVRQTRRTRKDSASNVENVEMPQTKPITGTIVEEETESSQKFQKSPIKSNEQNHSPSGSRKSPRLSLKKNKDSTKTNSNDTSENIDTNDLEDHNTSNKENERSLKEPTMFKEKISTINVSNVEKNNLSESNSELLQNLKTEPHKKTLALNKSTSAVADKLEFKTKRHRTKSWTTYSAPVLNDNVICFSDSESMKKKRKSAPNSSNSIDFENSSNTQKINSSLKKIIKSLPNDLTNDSKLDSLNTSNKIENDKILTQSQASANGDAVTSLFEKEPSATTIFVEETDSNPEKNIENIKHADEDQCVPVIIPHYKEESQNDVHVNFSYSKDKHEKIMSGNQNDSCEPMDIDETIPDSMSQSKSEKSSNKESISKEKVMESSISKGGKKRKSSITPSTSQVLEKSCNENKSTLVLSLLKDISNDNNVLQSSQTFTEKNANSGRSLDTTQDNNGLVERRNSLTAYSTSTPLHQKGLKKLVMNIDTSDMTSNNTSKIEKNDNKVNKRISSNVSNKSSNQSESDEESEHEESKLIDDEAEEASDDYESGDSKDKEQEQYEKENEIVHKGETLTSDDELSNDTDYEKDSFVVSSDAEDEDLLDGSGDDLSMSDNELKMTKESKKKYNERKLKEQKKASREMFESRHKLNVSNGSIKSESLNKKKKRAVINSSVSEDDDIKVKVKKNNKMRLDSSHEMSTNKSLNNSRNEQTEAKSLLKSINNRSATDEIEITIYDENSNNELDPLSIGIKKEPVTPQISTTNVPINFVDPASSIKNEDNKNKSHTNKTNIDDPLEDSNTSTSDSSDNIHIQNYESVLNELNNSAKNNKNKSADISLNLHKKTKQKTMPIIDELNLTQVKTKKQKQIQHKYEVDAKTSNKSIIEKSITKNKPNNEDNDNESSDSIDIHLLFSEDSNGSENLQNKKKNSEVEQFIPLKQSPGKTNILEISGSKLINASSKKKKELVKTLDKTGSEDEKGGTDEDVEIQFIMDTTGTHNSTEIEKSFNVNTTEKKIKQFVEDDDSSDSDAPAEVSNKSLKETARKEIEPKEEINSIALSMNNKSITKTSKSETRKREKRISESLAMHERGNNSESDAPAELSNKSFEETERQETNAKEDNTTISSIQNKSITKTPKSEKKNKRSESQTQDNKDDKYDSAPAEVSNKTFEETLREKNYIYEENSKKVSSMHNNSTTRTPKSEKKKKKASESLETGAADTPLNESVAKTPASVKKKRNRLSESQLAEQMCASDSYTTLRVNINTSSAERPDAQNIEDQNMETDAAEKAFNKSLIKTPLNDKKKKKRLSECQSNNISTNESHAIQENQDIQTDKSMNHSIIKTPKSEKKKKKKLSESQSAEQITNKVTTENDHNNSSNIQVSSLKEEPSNGSMANKSLTKTPKSGKKKAKTLDTVSSDNIVESVMEFSDKSTTQKSINPVDDIDITIKDNSVKISAKKRKRKSSHNQTDGEQDEGNGTQITSVTSPELTISEIQNKKRKISHNTVNPDQDLKLNKDIMAVQKEQRCKNTKDKDVPHNQVNFERGATETDKSMTMRKETRKRKQREDDNEDKTAKVQRITSPEKAIVPRLAMSILNQLEDKPKKNLSLTKSKVISTSNFIVEEAKTVKNKPSNYLEESVYLNEDELLESKKQKRIKNPKVLPFLPTVSTSISGYTTNFKVNVIPKEFKFVAKSSNVSNFKNDFLENKKIKRLGTYELYKKNRNVKLSKF